MTPELWAWLEVSATAVDPHPVVPRLLLVPICALRSALRSQPDLALENLVLRQQIAAFACVTRRPRISGADRWFRITLRRLWSRLLDVLVFVKPETVVRWHRSRPADDRQDSLLETRSRE